MAHSQQPNSIEAIDIIGSVALLASLALAHPLLDLLGRNAAFFVARDSPPSDIFAVAILVALLVPVLLIGLVLIVRRTNQNAGTWLLITILGVLCTLLVVQTLGRIGEWQLPGWLRITLAGAIAALIVLAYWRSMGLRGAVRLGVVVPFVVVGLFLFVSDVNALVRPASVSASGSVAIERPAPVVFIIFDGLSLRDLIDENGSVQGSVYPAFSRLAQDGTWYRNAVTQHFNTELSVPSILSGIAASSDTVPVLAEYPRNLFSMLSGSYEIKATEPITALCPTDACYQMLDKVAAWQARWSELVNDLGVVAGHLVLPEDIADGLPPIDETWGGFGATTDEVGDGASGSEGPFRARDAFVEAVESDRRRAMDTFVEGIQVSGEGNKTLHFLHALVPHNPWQYLPSGQLHDLPDARLTARITGDSSVGDLWDRYWVDDAWLTDQVYQLHLSQVEFADEFLGQVIDRLESLSLYDETLIVVMADHGLSYRPGMPTNRGASEILDDILPIPLFIKEPNQVTGQIDDYRALTTDVLPTVAEILGADLNWEFDGISLASESRPQRDYTEVRAVDGVVRFPAQSDAAFEGARQKVASFGAEGVFGLAPPGYHELLGATPDSLEHGNRVLSAVTLRDSTKWDQVDLTSEPLPASVEGRIDGAVDEAVIALALNGEVVSVTRSYLNSSGDSYFTALLPPTALRNGDNDVSLYEVTGRAPSFVLHHVMSL